MITDEEREAKIKVTSLNVRGETVPVYVNGVGRFFATYAGRECSAYKLDDLTPQLMALSRRKKIKVLVPATHITRKHWTNELQLRPIQLTGINARTERVEFKYDDVAHPTYEQIDPWRHDDRVLKPLTEAQMAEGYKLHAAHRAAEAAWMKFKERHKLDPKAAVQAAIDKQATDEEAVTSG